MLKLRGLNLHPFRRSTCLRFVWGVALVGILVLLNGCGSIPAPGEPSSRTVAANAADSLREIAAAVYGRPDDRRDAELLGYRTFQEPLNDCMAGLGHDYRKPLFVSLLAARSTPLIPDTFHALAELPTGDTLVPSVSADVAAAAAQAVAFTGEVYVDEPPSKSYSDALTTCVTRMEGSEPRWPEPDPALADKFFDVMERAVQDEFVVAESAKYPGCMKAELGVRVEDQVALYQLVSIEFAPFGVNRENPSATLEPLGPEWDATVGFEARAAAADRTCRAVAHEAALVAIAPELDRFMAENAEALEQSATDWAQLLVELRSEDVPLGRP